MIERVKRLAYRDLIGWLLVVAMVLAVLAWATSAGV